MDPGSAGRSPQLSGFRGRGGPRLLEFTSNGIAPWRGDPRIAGARRTARGTPDGPDQLALASPALRMNCAAGGLAAASLYVITVLKTDND